MSSAKIFPLYAKFLLDSGKLDELTNANMKLATAYNLQVMQYRNLDLRALTKEGLKNFLEDASKNKAFESAVVELQKWSSSELPISVEMIPKSDII